MTVDAPKSSSNANSPAFTPLKMGRMQLQHRIVMAPLTRFRSPEHIPTDRVAKYYGDRATPGGLLITEATNVSLMSGNYYDVPGIYTVEHQRAWKLTTDAVHAKGGYIYCQLWHIGRTSHPALLGGRQPLAPSANPMPGKVAFVANVVNGIEPPLDAAVPREMTHQDIADTIQDFVNGAKTAIAAGFDGVEIHGANGYLLDQFLGDNVNTRTDKYGGSNENRARFPLEVVDAVVEAVGADRVGIRLSPFGIFQGMASSDIFGQYGYVVSELDKRGLAFIDIIRPRATLMGDFETQDAHLERSLAALAARGVPESVYRGPEYQGLRPFRKIMKNTPLLGAGNYTVENLNETLEDGSSDAVSYGRAFIANPDLVERLRRGVKLTPYDRTTFYYVAGDRASEKGYNDYPVATASHL